MFKFTLASYTATLFEKDKATAIKKFNSYFDGVKPIYKVEQVN